ncbi:MAG TPA: outer membrane beta-barrel protein [Chthoniobacterales bacterium]|nr:outer membrane beta-barrel protein [Chthoniobacterales bacterium]
MRFGDDNTVTGSDKDVAEPAAESSNLGVGNFSPSRFHVTASVREGYDDNVYATTINAVSSFFTEGSLQLDYNFGSPRTTFNLEALAGGTYYYNRPFGQQYDINDALTLGLEHHATPRLTLSATAYVTYQSEPDFFNNQIGINRVGGNFFYTSDKFSAAYQWAPRFSTVTSYTLEAIHYDEAAIGAYEDRFDHTFGNEFRYLVAPTTAAVAEYRYEFVDYDAALLNSDTHFLLAGFDHSFNPHFNMSLRGGVEFREFDEIDFGERTSPYGELTVNYSGAHRSSVSFNARYGLEEPDVPNTASRTTFRSGITAAYGIAPRLTATASVFYEHDDNESFTGNGFFVPQFDEDLLDIGIGLRYEINRVFALLGGYDHTEDFSDIYYRQYSRDRYYLGASVTF